MPSRRDQLTMTTEEIDEFLRGRHTMSVATFNHDGTIHLVAMWYGFLDGVPALWTYGRSQKVRNLERDPRVTGLVEDGERYDQLRGVELVGAGEIIRDRAMVLAVGLSVYGRYTAPVTEHVPALVEQMGAKRIVVRFAIDKVVSWDHGKLAGAY
ncbi:MAG: pyridoxamine 5'-phosphate oxidase family protein [Acidimicrobiales bacterium]